MGVICPGTIQSGPADSTMASVANPFPIELGCYRSVPFETNSTNK